MGRSSRLSSFAFLLPVLVAGALATPALAGPAHYDKDSKSFRFTYTFAVLPGGGGDPQLGQVQKPTADQEKVVNDLVGRVSLLLSTVTNGRAKIGTLDYVDNIKNADLVVSLTGAPASAGFANLRAIEGQPGQIVLYYQTLVPMISQDVVLTATHELCHYIFGLTDEYTFPRGCPVRAGSACLMDNYFSSVRGFMGRFCTSADHDSEPAQQASCQDIVDQFFNKLGVEAGTPDTTTDATAAASAATDPRTAIVASAIGKVRAQHLENVSNGKKISNLKSFAEKTLKALIEQFNQDNSNPLILSKTGLGQILDSVVSAGQLIPVLQPELLGAKAFALIMQEAKRLGESVKDVKTEGSRLSKIKSGLNSYVQELVKAKRIDPKAFAPAQQKALIDQVARNAARDPSLQTLDRLVGINEISAQLDVAMAQDIITALDELNVPGTRQRLDFVQSLRSKLESAYSIPGRTFSRFGTRRTRIITPDAKPEYEYVLTQSGVYPYRSIRDRSVVQFSRLVNRSGNLQLVSPAAQTGGFQPLTARISRPFKDIPSEDASSSTGGVNIQEVISDTIDQLQRNRLENLAVLIPPGGLPIDLGAQVPKIRDQLPKDADVRLDLVLVGPAKLDTEVRDLALSTRGSVLTVTDIDEIGAIAQRLKNEQSSGNWVIIPQQATLGKQTNGNDAHDANPGLDVCNANVKAIRFAPQTGDAAKDAEALKNWKGPKTVGDISKRLGSALDRLNSLLDKDEKTNATQLEEGNRRAAQDASRALRWLRDATAPRSVKNAADSKKEGNLESSWTFDLASSPMEDKKKIDNKAFFEFLGRAREQLSRLRSSVNQMRTPSSGFANPELMAFAKQLTQESEDKPLGATTSATGEPESQPEGDTAKGSVSTLGVNLRYLDAIMRAYEHLFEASLIDQQGEVPIYKRIDRINMEKTRRAVEEARRQQTLGLAGNPPSLEGENRARLARFYAEGQAEFELIVGLTQELPNRPSVEGDKRFRMELVSDLGVRTADDAKVKFDSNASTPSLLVFRASTPQPLRPGWYTPVLVFKDPSDFAFLAGAETNFTFSVGSDRPNIQLITGLIQEPGTKSKGTVRRAEEYAAVEVQVSAPNSVLNARVMGYYQMITEGFESIDPREVEFRDDGTDAKGLSQGQVGFDQAKCDRSANDGIYTAFFPLTDVEKSTEFRIFIQADTTDGQARYIGLDNPHSGGASDDDDDSPTAGTKSKDKRTLVRQAEATKAAEGSVLKFQRATTFHFHADL
ncbi:hypothetical protein [Singulisphaera sp. PoT]|uniref:hypothetical protein n=1 Tax=Singulisphaera sp. PoT TaxID=3411797 RepID=UPI003BF4E075